MTENKYFELKGRDFVHYLVKKRQKYSRQTEMRFVSAYLATFHPNDLCKTHVLLGAYPEPPRGTVLSKEKQLALGAMRKWADAIVISQDKLTLIEGKLIIHRYFEGLGQLQVYRRIVPETPELQPYLDRPIESILLVPVEDPLVRTLCLENNIRMVIWRPAFVEEYLMNQPTKVFGRQT
jgi:hypothetical protein